jgi:hypothetical protein
MLAYADVCSVGVLPHAREAVRAFKHVAQRGVWFNMLQVLCLLALLVPKYKY